MLEINKTDRSQGVYTLDFFRAQTFPFSTLDSVEKLDQRINRFFG